MKFLKIHKNMKEKLQIVSPDVMRVKRSYLFEFFLPQAVCKAGWVALLVQIHLHELLYGQLTGGCFPKLDEPNEGEVAG